MVIIIYQPLLSGLTFSPTLSKDVCLPELLQLNISWATTLRISKDYEGRSRIVKPCLHVSIFAWIHNFFFFFWRGLPSTPERHKRHRKSNFSKTLLKVELFENAKFSFKDWRRVVSQNGTFRRRCRHGGRMLRWFKLLVVALSRAFSKICFFVLHA